MVQLKCAPNASRPYLVSVSCSMPCIVCITERRAVTELSIVHHLLLSRTRYNSMRCATQPHNTSHCTDTNINSWHCVTWHALAAIINWRHILFWFLLWAVSWASWASWAAYIVSCHLVIVWTYVRRRRRQRRRPRTYAVSDKSQRLQQNTGICLVPSFAISLFFAALSHSLPLTRSFVSHRFLIALWFRVILIKSIINCVVSLHRRIWWEKRKEKKRRTQKIK